MSRFDKIEARKLGAKIFPLLTKTKTTLTSAEKECRADVFAEFVKYLVGFREGKQSSCRGSWTAKEYSDVRLLLRQVPKTEALEMYATQMLHQYVARDDS